MPDIDLRGLLQRVRMDQAIIIDLLDAGAGTTPEIDAAMRRIYARLIDIERAVLVTA